MPAPSGPRDLPRIVVGVLFILTLGGASLWVLKPFLPALVWATMIVVATWPLLERAQRVLWHRRSLAVIVMMLALLVILIAPLAAALWTLAGQAERLVALTSIDLSIPGPPSWVEALPLVGAKIAAEWQFVASAEPESLAERAAPYMTQVGRWLLQQLGGVGNALLHLGLTVVLCAVLYWTGGSAAKGIRLFFRRLDGERGEKVVLLAGASIRAVALGIVVTALVQTALGALGLLVSGVPYIAILSALMFVCCIAQIGPSLVLIGAVVWLWYTGGHGWAIALGVWTVIVASLDNVLRPILIRRGADLPFLLILGGVLGGLLMFGIVGLFVGPVVLAIAYNLLGAWVAEGDPTPHR
ncbi:Putative transport protein YdiK [Burkholderiales bacterium]|nr:Putative transport protein YdiK [Burkholderiales bacterium]